MKYTLLQLKKALLAQIQVASIGNSVFYDDTKKYIPNLKNGINHPGLKNNTANQPKTNTKGISKTCNPRRTITLYEKRGRC